MSDCPVKIDLIYDDENIGDSLTKINQNFAKVLSGACLIEDQLDKMVNIRTFFYYGPNAPTESESTWSVQPDSASRPSAATIEAFVNNGPDVPLPRVPGLNLPSISEVGDIAYVIYQKTGWLSQTQVYDKSGTGSLPFQRTVRRRVVRSIGIGGGKCWVAREVYNHYNPKWQIFREWLYSQGPKWLQNLYTTKGEQFAKYISDKPKIKNTVRQLMDLVVPNDKLVKYSYISTPEGPVRIEDLKEEDEIIGFVPKTGKLGNYKIRKIKQPKSKTLIRIVHEFGELVVNRSQWVYTKNGRIGENKKYIEAKKIDKNDFVILECGTESKVLSAETIESDYVLPVLEIDDVHNYIINGVRVHNGGGGGGGQRVTYEPYVETYYVGYSWSTKISDTYNYYAPTFVIYRLTFNGNVYIMDSGFPKFTQASTASTELWGNPELWTTY
jgi:hypothetical protein